MSESSYVRFYDFAADFDHDLGFYGALDQGNTLELACGSGRLLTALAPGTVGLDLDPQMLSRARAAHPDAELVEGDLRTFDLRRHFDLIVLAANGLCLPATPDGQRRCLERVRAHLTDGGRFAIDLPNPAPFLADRQPFDRELHLYTRLNPTTGLQTARYTTHHHDAFHQLIVGETRYVEYEEAGTTREYTSREVLRYIHPPELELMFERAGLQIIERWGWFDRRPVDPRGPKLVVVARAG